MQLISYKSLKRKPHVAITYQCEHCTLSAENMIVVKHSKDEEPTCLFLCRTHTKKLLNTRGER